MSLDDAMPGFPAPLVNVLAHVVMAWNFPRSYLRALREWGVGFMDAEFTTCVLLSARFGREAVEHRGVE